MHPYMHMHDASPYASTPLRSDPMHHADMLARERYLSDYAFHALVNDMTRRLETAALTPAALSAAVQLACLHARQSRTWREHLRQSSHIPGAPDAS